jgi:SAM-dependent methyltransferase
VEIKMDCRYCGENDIFHFLDLGTMALANSFVSGDELPAQDEKKFPLDVYFCRRCGLVQIGYVVPPEIIFRNYIYYSATSDLVHDHARYLARSFKQRYNLSADSLVVEIASNDGTVLRCFKEEGLRVLGVEPATNIAVEAEQSGIPTLNDFFNEESAGQVFRTHGKADVILGRHVFAHVPEIHGFVRGIKSLLATDGVVAIEAPYLVDFITRNEFDTVYHEHYSYLSVRAMAHLFSMYDMEVFDAEEVGIHGGSMIYYIGNRDRHPVSPNVGRLVAEEIDKGLDREETYAVFAERVPVIREKTLEFLHDCRSKGKRVAAYGAPAKGNTFLNYCGIGPDLLEYTVDKSSYKQGLYTPGAHIPVFHPDRLQKDMPDYVLLLAWNFKDEIILQQRAYLEKGGRFVQAIPRIEIIGG